MKVLIDHHGPPFFLAHGGATTQVHQTAKALGQIGVEIDYLKWWDASQTCDLIHCFGVPRMNYLAFAKEKRIPVVNTTLFTATCNRSSRRLSLQGSIISSLLRIPSVPPWNTIRPQLNWECFNACDLNVVGLRAEAEVLQSVYHVPEFKIHIAPLGLATSFLAAPSAIRDQPYLITTGTITERKRCIELAKLAKIAEVPILFVGKPYDEQDRYWQNFNQLIDNRFVLHKRHTEDVQEMISLLHHARGYVLYSDYENWCLSAHEAIACGVPILVPDQRWSRELFGDQASYFGKKRSRLDARLLRDFYDHAMERQAPQIKLYSWKDAAASLVGAYEKILARQLRP